MGSIPSAPQAVQASRRPEGTMLTTEAALSTATGSSIVRSRRRAAVLLIAPATLLLLAIFVYPFLYALRISFTEWTLGQQLTPIWTGFANYASLFGDDRFL